MSIILKYGCGKMSKIKSHDNGLTCIKLRNKNKKDEKSVKDYWYPTDGKINTDKLVTLG
jgi:hypothetical protein